MADDYRDDSQVTVSSRAEATTEIFPAGVASAAETETQEFAASETAMPRDDLSRGEESRDEPARDEKPPGIGTTADFDALCVGDETLEFSSPGDLADQRATIEAPGGSADGSAGESTEATPVDFELHADCWETMQRDDVDQADGGDCGDLDFALRESLQATWNDAAKTARPQMTIRAGTSHSGAHNSTLVIQDRKIRTPREPDGGLADYDLIAQLGEGGMGVVYTARQASIDRTVALKMLKPTSAADENSKQKFLSEAVVTGELDHPNIVPIYDLGRKADGTLFYSMKKIQGTPWMDVIRQHPLAENIEILMKVADAVAFAHSRGVIHRDLKPENVMLGEFGEVLVLDWGLAMTTPDCRKAETLPASQSLGGTPAYMAPELILGPIEAIGRHSDIYLLGAILYECITGSPPHTGPTTMSCIIAAGRNVIVPTEKSGELVDIAVKAMARDPADRYASVQAFQQAIRQYQSHSESVTLATRAEVELRHACETGNYNDLAKALFGFQEAHALWPENTEALAGISQARLAYAQRAYQNGDYDLGLSTSDPCDASHQAVREQLLAGQRERDARLQRLKQAKRTVAALVALVFLAITIGMAGFAFQWKKTDAARQDAVVQRNAAVAARDEADSAKRTAETAAENEKQARGLADAARMDAERARREAESARDQAQYEAYLTSIGLAAVKIEENALGGAREVLGKCEIDYRGWEWHRLAYLCQLAAARLEFPHRLEALAFHPSGNILAVGGRDGAVELRDRTSGRRLARTVLADDGVPTALGFVPSRPDQLLIGSTTPPYLQLWNWNQPDASADLKPWYGHEEQVNSIRFSADGGRLLTASSDNTARIWHTDDGQLVHTLRGHTWRVWSADFSPDDQLIVTASDDGTSRIWHAATGQQLLSGSGQEMPFRGHHGSVRAATFVGSGQVVASGGHDGRLLIWRVGDLRPFDFQSALRSQTVQAQRVVVCQGHSAAISRLLYVNEGQLLSASHDNSIRVWAVPKWTQQTANDSPGDGVASDHYVTSLKTLRGHSQLITDLQHIPLAAGQVATVGHDRTCRIWQVNDYAEELRLPRPGASEGHRDEVLGASFSGDSSYVVTASRDRTAAIWDVHTGRCLRQLREGHQYLTSRALVFPNGTRMLTAAMDGTTRVWNLQAGTQELLLRNTGYAAAVAVSPDGRWVATGRSQQEGDEPASGQSSRIGVVQIWDALTGEKIADYDGHRAAVSALAFSLDGKLLFSGDANGRGNLWNVSSGERITTLRSHTGRITAAVFVQDSSVLFTASLDKTVMHWPLSSASQPDWPAQLTPDRNAVLAHPSGVTDIVYSHHTGQIVTAAEDGTVRCFDTATQQPLWQWHQQDSMITSVSLSNSYPLVLVADGKQQQVHLLSLHDGQAQRLGAKDATDDTVASSFPPSPTMIWSATFTPAGDQYVTVGGDEAILWNLAHERQQAYRPHQAVTSAAFSPDGHLVVTASEDGTAKLWNSDTGRPIFKLSGTTGGHTAAVNRAEFSPDGHTVLTASDDGSVKLWSASTGQPQQTYRIPAERNAAVLSARFARDGRHFVFTTAAGGVYEASPTSTRTRRLGFHFGPALDADYSYDSQLIASVGADYRIVLWDRSAPSDGSGAPQPLAEFPQQTDRVTSVAFAPREQRLLTGGDDQIVRVWDFSSFDPQTNRVMPREVMTLKGHSQAITRVAYSDDGQYVLSSSRDGSAIIWPSLPRPDTNPASGNHGMESLDAPLWDASITRRSPTPQTRVSSQSPRSPRPHGDR